VIREAVFSLKNFLLLKRKTKKNIKIKLVGPIGLAFLAHIFGALDHKDTIDSHSTLHTSFSLLKFPFFP
jgi:hypothetical protein